MTVDELLDRESIRDVLARYSRGVDRLDSDALTGVFHADSIENHGEHESSGPQFVTWIIPLLRERYIWTSHQQHNVVIDFDAADSARTETYFTAIQVHDVDGKTVQEEVYGRYVDLLSKSGGAWRISRRTVVVDGQNSFTVAGWQGASDITKLAGGTRDRQDPIYKA